MTEVRSILLALLGALAAAPVRADDLWAGLYRHDVVINSVRAAGGEDLKIGWIGKPLAALGAIGAPSPHLLVSKHLGGTTDYAAAGLDWTFGTKFYARPGIGLAVNDGHRPAYRKGERVDLGSPATFEPELALGWRVAPRLRLEASWIHLSHAHLFSHQNHGLDSWGVRTLVRLP